LEEHANDGHHRESSIGKFCVQPSCFGVRVVCCKQRWLPSHVSRSVIHVVIIVGLELREAGVRYHLNPACEWNLAERTEAVWNVGELQVLTGRQKPWELPRELWGDVAHGSKHAYPAVFNFHRSATLERELIPIFGESHRIEKPNGCLHTKLILECSQW